MNNLNLESLFIYYIKNLPIKLILSKSDETIVALNNRIVELTLEFEHLTEGIVSLFIFINKKIFFSVLYNLQTNGMQLIII